MSDTLRVLVVDDSAYNRQTITNMLEERSKVEVVGRAVNGKEALKLVFDLDPDVITLDLEMPEMDGFSFLRLLMSKRPIPVLVISGYAQRDNVFRALELGALDFIAKPGRHISPDIREIAEDLSAKIGMVRRLKAVRLKERADLLAAQRNTRPRPALGSDTSAPLPERPPTRVIAIGASTGGPPAIQQLLATLPADLDAAILIAQHMPARFTRAFAARLDRVLPFRVVEGMHGQPLSSGVVYVAPGENNLHAELDGSGQPRVQVVGDEKLDGPSITPSADHLFKSLASVFKANLCAVVLTGMGSDGAKGVTFAKKMGATILVEDPDTAVMPGMPHSAVETGVADQVLSLENLASAIVAFVSDKGDV